MAAAAGVTQALPPGVSGTMTRGNDVAAAPGCHQGTCTGRTTRVLPGSDLTLPGRRENPTLHPRILLAVNEPYSTLNNPIYMYCNGGAPCLSSSTCASEGHVE